MAYTFSSPIASPELRDGKKLDIGRHNIPSNEVPASWFKDLQSLKWCDEEFKMPSDVSNLGLSTRGQDPVDFAALNPKERAGSRTFMPTQMQRGTLLLKYQDDRVTELGGHEAVASAGMIRFCITEDTQYPALFMVYSQKVNDQTSQIKLIFHGNTSMADVLYYTFDSVSRGDLQFDLPASERKFADAKTSLAINIKFGQSTNQERYLNSVTVLHDKDTRWTSNDDMIRTFDNYDEGSVTLTSMEKAIYDMFYEKDISLTFLRVTKAPDNGLFLRRFDAQFSCWAAHMRLCIEHGIFWFYRMQPPFKNGQAGAQLVNWNSSKVPPPVPFWLVKKFQATVTDKGLTILQPLKWAPICPDPNAVGKNGATRFLHPDNTTFLQELSILRERAFEYASGQQIFDPSEKHEMSFIRLEQFGKQTFWRIEVNTHTRKTEDQQLTDGLQTQRGEKIVPPPGSNVALQVDISPSSESEHPKLYGTVFEDLSKPEKVDFVVHATVPNDRSEKLLNQVKDGAIRLHGTMRVITSFISVDRMISAFRGISEDVDHAGVLKRMGPHQDARNFLLGYLPRYPGNIRSLDNGCGQVGLDYVYFRLDQWAKEHIPDYVAQGQNFDAVFSWFGFPTLNPVQKQAIFSALSGGRGNLTIIHGPPGTGKSATLDVVVVLAKVIFDAKIAVCTPTNAAADSVMEKLLETMQKCLQPKKIPLKLVRFLTTSGTPIGRDAKLAALPEGLKISNSDNKELAQARAKLWGTSARFVWWSLFEHKKRLAIKYAHDDAATPAQKKAAVDFMSNLQPAINRDLFGDNKKKYNAADLVLGRAILENDCDVLIGTLNSMGREDVPSAFPCDTIVVDEMAQALLPDVAIPFNTFQDTAVRAVAAGDHKQLNAQLQSSEANETNTFTSKSIFKELCESGQYGCFMLDVQYRAHPKAYEFPNQAFYGGKVTAAPFLSNVTDVDKTVVAFLERETKKTFDAETCPRLIVIDMDCASEQWPGTSSSWNRAETEFVRWLRNAMIEFRPSQDSRKLTLRDFLVISPYRGQVAALKDALQQQGVIQTVTKSQGGEGSIGITSFTKNIPTNPFAVGFIKDPKLLNVMLSGPKRFNFLIGNFSGRQALAKSPEKSVSLTYLSNFIQHALTKGIVLKAKDFINFDATLRVQGTDIDDESMFKSSQFSSFTLKDFSNLSFSEAKSKEAICESFH